MGCALECSIQAESCRAESARHSCRKNECLEGLSHLLGKWQSQDPNPGFPVLNGTSQAAMPHTAQFASPFPICLPH